MAPTAPQENAMTASAALQEVMWTSHPPAQDTQAGISPAASALLNMKAEETHTLSSTTPTALTMWVCGRSTAATGLSAMAGALHVT